MEGIVLRKVVAGPGDDSFAPFFEPPNALAQKWMLTSTPVSASLAIQSIRFTDGHMWRSSKKDLTHSVYGTVKSERDGSIYLSVLGEGQSTEVSPSDFREAATTAQGDVYVMPNL